MTTRPSDDLRDERFDAAWRRASSESPPARLDDAIRAAARREVGARPHDVVNVPEATRPQRWWFPLAAAATIGAIAVGVLQLSTPERVAPVDEQRIVSDTPSGAKDIAASGAAPAATPVPQPSVPETQPAAAPSSTKPPPAQTLANAKTQPSAVAEQERKAERRQRAEAPREREPQAFPAARDETRSAERQAAAQAPGKDQRAAASSPTGEPPATRPAFSAQALRPDRAAHEAASESRMKSRLATEEPPPGSQASSTAAAADAVAQPPQPAAPPVGATAPMSAPARAAAKLAGERSDSIEGLAKERSSLAAGEWIALMRRLRDEGRYDELDKELAAFRSLHTDARELLPPDLRDVRAPVR